MNLPSGTVSFLFTDIEGSTRLWERYPDAMRVALRLHNDLMQTAVDNNNGVVFLTVGDAYCCAFERPTDALAAAVQAQQFLQTEDWSPEAVIRVRMAVHVGAVEIAGDNYVAPCLNRIARLLAIAHGEQTLVSQAIFELVRDSLPEDVNLVPMGSHRLKDLSRPEQVYQVQVPGTRDVFPPLRSLGSPDLPNNLPEQLTSFVGRVKEVQELEYLLPRTRLLTLVGPGGVGKTRLSLQVGASLIDQYPHGVFVAELAPLDTSASIASGVARALNIRDTGTGSADTAVQQFFGSQHLLLILDNTEHVIADATQFVDGLLRACPNLSVLATSREPLNLSGEQIYRLAPLALPPLNTQDPVPSPVYLSQFEAVRLFIERALTHRPDFAVTTANAPFVAEVCHRVDGIPLAIELAAARLRSLSIEEIAKRIGERFRLLTGGSRTALPRQQTLRALVDWSHELLPETERILLRRLSIFAGGATIAAAEQVCADDEHLNSYDILDLVSALVEKSLLVPDETGTTIRYQMLETIRQYGFDKLQIAGEVDTTRQRLIDWCVAFCEESNTQFTVARQRDWLSHISVEYPNLVIGLESGGDSQLRICARIWRFWQLRGLLREGRTWCEQAIYVSSEIDSDGNALRADILVGLGWMAELQGDSVAAAAWLDEAKQIYLAANNEGGIADAVNIEGFIAFNHRDYDTAHRLFAEAREKHLREGDMHGSSWATQNLGNVAFMRNDLTAAERYYKEGLAIMRTIGDERGAANAISNLAIVLNGRGEYQEADLLMREGLELRRRTGDATGIATSLHNLGMVSQNLGNLEHAAVFLEEAVTIRRRMSNRRGIASSLHNLGVVYATQDRIIEARPLFWESLMLRREFNDEPDMVETVEEWAGIYAKEGNIHRAAQLWSLTVMLRPELDIPLSVDEQAVLNTRIEDARSHLSASEWEVAWNTGRCLLLQETASQIILDEKNPHPY